MLTKKTGFSETSSYIKQPRSPPLGKVSNDRKLLRTEPPVLQNYWMKSQIINLRAIPMIVKIYKLQRNFRTRTYLRWTKPATSINKFQRITVGTNTEKSCPISLWSMVTFTSGWANFTSRRSTRSTKKTALVQTLSSITLCGMQPSRQWERLYISRSWASIISPKVCRKLSTERWTTRLISCNTSLVSKRSRGEPSCATFTSWSRLSTYVTRLSI